MDPSQERAILKRSDLGEWGDLDSCRGGQRQGHVLKLGMKIAS